MSIAESNAYQRVMQKRARRLGISVEEAQRESVSKSRYLAATEAAATRLGVKQESILDDDRRRLENSNYPTTECITPEDVEDLVEALGAQHLGIQEIHTEKGREVVASVWSKQMSHLTTCDPCRTLVSACQPSLLRRNEFLRFVQEKFPVAAARA
jgi:hypothetical protein